MHQPRSYRRTNEPYVLRVSGRNVTHNRLPFSIPTRQDIDIHRKVAGPDLAGGTWPILIMWVIRWETVKAKMRV